MVIPFEEGETYTNAKLEKDIMVLGIASKTDKDVTLAILWVDRESHETTGGDELTVSNDDFKDWKAVPEDV